MSFLVPSRGDRDPNPLGLPSRYEIPREVRKARDVEIGKSIARTQVIEMDMQGIEHAGHTALMATRSISQASESAAMSMPHDRHRLDAVADMVSVMLQAKLRELGGLAP